MKTNVCFFLFLLYSVSFSFAQNLSISGFVGSSESVEYSNFSFQSIIDTNFHSLTTVSKNLPTFRPAVSINFKNGEFLEASTIKVEDSGTAFRNGTFRLEDKVGNIRTSLRDFSLDYYFKVKSLQSEKLKIFWSPGLSLFDQRGTISPSEGSTIYRYSTKDLGFILKFLTRFRYDLPVPSWKIEGGFGINAFDYRFQRIIEKGELIKQNKLELNDRLSAFARIGISYFFNFKKKEDS